MYEMSKVNSPNRITELTPVGSAQGHVLFWAPRATVFASRDTWLHRGACRARKGSASPPGPRGRLPEGPLAPRHPARQRLQGDLEGSMGTLGVRVQTQSHVHGAHLYSLRGYSTEDTPALISAFVGAAQPWSPGVPIWDPRSPDAPELGPPDSHPGLDSAPRPSSLLTQVMLRYKVGPLPSPAMLPCMAVRGHVTRSRGVLASITLTARFS